jgi:hypothetical protein
LEVSRGPLGKSIIASTQLQLGDIQKTDDDMARVPAGLSQKLQEMFHGRTF